MAQKKRTMTEEQRLAAAERLRLAREARGHDGSSSIHPYIRDLDSDHPLHWKKVKVWIKELRLEIDSKKMLRDSKIATERSEYLMLNTYVGNLKKYLSTGVYHDSRYGRHREGRMNTVVLHMAYNDDGTPKRTLGHIYPDCGEYTKEMRDAERRQK